MSAVGESRGGPDPAGRAGAAGFAWGRAAEGGPLAGLDRAAVGEPEDWGELVEFPRSLAGNQIAYLMRERPDRSAVRISLRSNPPFAVAPVAAAFGGGGHQQAAGCTFPGNLDAALKDVLPRLRRALDR